MIHEEHEDSDDSDGMDGVILTKQERRRLNQLSMRSNGRGDDGGNKIMPKMATNDYGLSG